MSSQQVGRDVRGPARKRESEAGRIKRPGRVLSPAIGRVVVQQDHPAQREKADGVQWSGRQPSWRRQGECPGHPRGLRPGHGSMGVTWELGRAKSLRV